MNSTLKRIALLSIAGLVALAPMAQAINLWDQSGFDAGAPGFFNSESGGPPFGSTNHVACDVTVANPWVVTDVTMYFSAIDPGWGGAISQGYVHVWPKTAALPTEDPTLSMVVPMTGTLGGTGDYFEVTASGLSVNLGPGDYWIGLTPIAPSGPMGPEICLSAVTYIGDATASYDVFAFPGPPAWFNFNPGVDAAILIQGDMPVPTEESTWGRVKSLYK